MNQKLNWLFGSLKVKAGILLLAILLWFLVVTEKIYEYNIHIPVQTVASPLGKVPSTPLPGEVTVRFRGRGKELLRLLFVQPPHLIIDLSSHSTPGVLKLRPEMVVIPGGTTAIPAQIISPDSVVINLDDFTVAAIPVSARLEVTLAPGFTYSDEPLIVPPTVKVSGPASSIARISAVETEPIGLNDLDGSSQTEVRLISPPGETVKIEPSVVSVTVKVDRLGEREIIDVPVKVRNALGSSKFVIEPPFVRLNLKGAVSRLAGVIADSVTCWIDYREQDAAHPGRFGVHTTAPRRIEVSSVTPASVKVLVRTE